jgi:transposase
MEPNPPPPADRLALLPQRLGALPVLNHFLDRLGLEAILERFVPTRDPRTKISHSRCLGVLLRSVIVEREPIYRQQETVATYAPSAFGLSEAEVSALGDDALGRALDRLFAADRGALLTACVVAAGKSFGLSFAELHNDSTTVRFCGQYPAAQGRSIRGKRAPAITYGYSKDHRPDLKQLLFILTVSADGNVPVQFRGEDGNTSDSRTHLATWEALVSVAGRVDFLYVADSKLCSTEVMEEIDERGGRLLTVLPRSRREDRQFREWIQEFDPPWEKVRDRPNPRGKFLPRDVWYAYRHPGPSSEGWPITWLYSTLLRAHQRRSRQDRIELARRDLERLKKRLERPGAQKRSQQKIEERVRKILTRRRVHEYLKVWTYEHESSRFRQERPGRPGRETKYVKEFEKRWSLSYEVNTVAIAFDKKSDGMYPLLSNDRELSAAQAFEAHKRQPKLEKRFQQLKSVHEIAPVFLKNEGRIEAFFLIYFLALLVQALVERELRRAMVEKGIERLPLYPEERPSRHPTADLTLKLFSHLQAHVLCSDGKALKRFQPELTELQQQVLQLLGVPPSSYFVSD